MKTEIEMHQLLREHPTKEGTVLVYRMLAIPTDNGKMYTLLISEEEEGAVLACECVSDLTRNEGEAARFLHLCAEGLVLPGMANETVLELL